MNIGFRIKEILKSKGMTQIELAEKLSITKQQVSFIVTGNRGTTLTTLQKLSNALEVPIYEFFRDKKEKIIPPDHFNAFLEYLREQKAFLEFHLSEADKERETPSYQRYIYLKKLIESYES